MCQNRHFNSNAVSEPENAVEHFIDSTGVISCVSLAASTTMIFCEWDFSGTNVRRSQQSIWLSLEDLCKEVYIAEIY